MKSTSESSQDSVVQLALNQVREKRIKIGDEVRDLYRKVYAHGEHRKENALELMTKQTNLIREAIELAESLGQTDCIEKEYRTKYIINNAYDKYIKKCKDLTKVITTFSDDVDNVISSFNNYFEDTEDEVENCGMEYTLTARETCVEYVMDSYRFYFEYDRTDLNYLQEETERVSEDIDEFSLVCTINARFSVLKSSRLGSARIHACLKGETLPVLTPSSPPIKFLKTSNLTPMEEYVNTVLDKHGNK